jgi:uncharacterized membrane protein YhiD involved in acid resistance
MLNDLKNILNVSVTPEDILINLFVSLIAGIIISFFYRKSYVGPGYQVSFVNSLIILVIITAIVIMVIGNNLARAFGLVGAMSIIRFRTAVKEMQDIIYIFFSLAIGMAVGVGFHGLALFGSIFIGTITYLLAKSKFSIPIKSNLLLQFVFDSEKNESQDYIRLINQYCKTFKLINTKAVGSENMIELSYYVGLKDKNDSADFIQRLRKLEGIENVNLFYDEEYF